jgi:hypothetical protein
MKLKELKDFVNNLPDDFDDFTVVNGEFGLLDPHDPDSIVYRIDKPVLVLNVEENDKEIVLLHQTRDEVSGFMEDNGNS